MSSRTDFLNPVADAAAYNPRPEYAISSYEGFEMPERIAFQPILPPSCVPPSITDPLPPLPPSIGGCGGCRGGGGRGATQIPSFPSLPTPCGTCSSCSCLNPADCGRYNYGTACGAKHIGPFPEAMYRCKVDKTKCCAAAFCKCAGGCGLPCETPCPPGSGVAPCTIPCTNAKTCGFTEIGYVFSTDAYPITTYLTKSCGRCSTDPFLRGQFAECTGCRTDAVPIDRADDGAAFPYLPLASSMTVEDKFHNQRRESAFERPTTFSNNSIGISPFSNVVGGLLPPCGTTKSSEMGWNHGLYDSSSTKNLTGTDPFYHPRTTITVPTVSRYYTLYARRIADCSRLQFAVAPAGVCDPVLTILPDDPRRPPGCCYYANGCGINNIDRGIVELRSGDQIYLTATGEMGMFFVHLWADSSGMAGILRQNNSVFRGWGPVRRNPDEVRRFSAPSGMRPWNTPAGTPLLRPW